MSTIQSAPAQGSILAEILRALRDGERLTSKAALQRFGHSRLAAAVHQLQRKYCVPINSRTIEVVSRNGRTAYVSEYWIGGTE
jgi:hypothetical protein